MMSSMKTPTIVLAAVLGLPALVLGQAEKKTEGEEIDLDQRKASIPIIEQHIADREERMTEIANDIITLDKRLEGKLDKIVKRLASISDSQKSGFRVSQIKKQAMDGLGRTIERYQQNRRSVVQEIREGRTGIPKEVLDGDAKIFDEHIEKRVEQILEISKSFTQDQDVKKYEEVEGTGGWGWGTASRISDEYKQNRRDRVMNKKQRDEVMEALKKSIERKKNQVSDLRLRLKNPKLSAADREITEQELNRSIAILDSRQGQLEELVLVNKPSTQEISRDAALDLQDALKDAADDMRHDFDTIFRKYSELNRERSKVFKLKDNLEARKKWIADYEAKQSGKE